MLAEPLQHLLVVHEAVQRAQQEGVEGQVADLLQLKVPAEVLQPPGAPDAGLQHLQRLAVLPEVSCKRLEGSKDKSGGAQWISTCMLEALHPVSFFLPKFTG